MQGTEDGWGVHRGNIADAGTDGLGLNVEVRLIRISGVPHYGDGLAQLDVITNLDADAARVKCAIIRYLPPPISITMLLPL